jgi:hypothetical protein
MWYNEVAVAKDEQSRRSEMRVPQMWRMQTSNYRMTGSVCRSCGYRAFPAREQCPACQSQNQTAIPVEIVMSLPLVERHEYVRVEAGSAMRALYSANQRDV